MCGGQPHDDLVSNTTFGCTYEAPVAFGVPQLDSENEMFNGHILRGRLLGASTSLHESPRATQIPGTQLTRRKKPSSALVGHQPPSMIARHRHWQPAVWLHWANLRAGGYRSVRDPIKDQIQAVSPFRTRIEIFGGKSGRT